MLKGRHVRQIDGVLRQIDRLDVVRRVEEVPREGDEGVGSQVEALQTGVSGENTDDEPRQVVVRQVHLRQVSHPVEHVARDLFDAVPL